MRVGVHFLGQSGLKLKFGKSIIYIDPYLSNSVQELGGSDLERLIPIPFKPKSVSDADWILITHDHIDHCDPLTLPEVAKASPKSLFMGPPPVIAKLSEWGIPQNRLHLCDQNNWIDLASDLKVISTLAAHPELCFDENNRSIFVGYIIEWSGKRIYHTGDTSLTREVIENVHSNGPIHTALIPVNERNFYREQKGIIGNMGLRDAFGFASELEVKQMIPLHWDMFAENEVTVEEIHAVYRYLKPSFGLRLKPSNINLGDVQISIIIRTLNEAKHLGDLLRSISEQEISGYGLEVIIVDSGSSDQTLEIAKSHNCRIIQIKKEQFSFGRSLNFGCKAADGDYLVITSGHCVPIDKYWLLKLCEPLINKTAKYSYGRQIGGPETQFSEHRIFSKYYPAESKIQVGDYFCNNANSALLRDSWESHQFDDELTGLEDMDLAKRLVNEGQVIAYVPDSCVYHYHYESWAQIRRRFEREAIALRQIMPQLHVTVIDTIRYIFTSVFKDLVTKPIPNKMNKNILGIVLYRVNQYYGSWKGNKFHRKLSATERETYFYPS